MKLELIDELTRPRHIHLEKNDKCYSWREYTARRGPKYSETNSLISNLKIPDSETHRISFRNNAIEKIAEEFIQVIKKEETYKCTYVPVPPSKNENEKDKLIQILERVGELKDLPLDIRPMIKQLRDTESVHKSSKRPSIQELSENYKINESVVQVHPSPKRIIIFDDVITTGSHFKAIQNLLSNYFPSIPIYGLFIAQTVFDYLDLFEKHKRQSAGI